MPVIGRLDGQVDEVLIAPLGKPRRRDEERRGEEPPRAEDARRDDDEKHASLHRQPGKEAARGELPVWLL